MKSFRGVWKEMLDIWCVPITRVRWAVKLCMTGRNPEVKEVRVYRDSVWSCLAGQAPVWEPQEFSHTWCNLCCHFIWTVKHRQIDYRVQGPDTNSHEWLITWDLIPYEPEGQIIYLHRHQTSRTERGVGSWNACLFNLACVESSSQLDMWGIVLIFIFALQYAFN